MTTPAPKTLYRSNIASLPLVQTGKVRDIYAVGNDHLLIVASDRLSAFDVVMNEPIPGKGCVLTALSSFWFARFAALIPNHLAELTLTDVLPDLEERAQVTGRAIVVKKLKPLPIEAIVRGYLSGSGWKDYQHSGNICGITLPAGMRQAEVLPRPIFTPSTKAALGAHDENVSFEHACDIVGHDVAARVRALALEIYRSGAAYARERGIIVADTKFEFGLDDKGSVHLIDEVLTPDSSRFWPQEAYCVGISPPSFDKQFVRDYLDTLAWNKNPPPPTLPHAVVAQTAAKYEEALQRLTYDERVGVD